MGRTGDLLSVQAELELGGLDDEHARAVADHRRVTIKKPLTAFAARLLAKEFAKCPDPNIAAEVMIASAWMGFKASWLSRAGSDYHRVTAASPSDHFTDLAGFYRANEPAEGDDRGQSGEPLRRLPSISRH